MIDELHTLFWFLGWTLGLDRITRFESREATHEKQLDDPRSRATNAEQQLAQLTWQLQDAQADLVKAQGDLGHHERRGVAPGPGTGDA